MDGHWTTANVRLVESSSWDVDLLARIIARLQPCDRSWRGRTPAVALLVQLDYRTVVTAGGPGDCERLAYWSAVDGQSSCLQR